MAILNREMQETRYEFINQIEVSIFFINNVMPEKNFYAKYVNLTQHYHNYVTSDKIYSEKLIWNNEADYFTKYILTQKLKKIIIEKLK